MIIKWMLTYLERMGDKIKEAVNKLKKAVHLKFICIKGRFSRKKKSGLYYVNGADILPPPLSREEERPNKAEGGGEVGWAVRLSPWRRV